MTDRHDVRHPRHPHNGVSTLPTHAASALAAVSGRRAELYYQRQRLLEVGEPRPRRSSPSSSTLDRTPGAPMCVASSSSSSSTVPSGWPTAFQQALDRGWHGAELVEPLLTRPWGMLEEVTA